MSFSIPKLAFVALITLILFLPTKAQTGQPLLRLEFAQEGDPYKPRALILIHDALESRESLSLFLKTWGDRDRRWARSQYCSVYTYEYESGIRNLENPETLAKELYQRIQRNQFRTSTPDSTNPKPKTFPFDGRQPRPSLKSKETEILLVGVGFGGLIARDTAVLAKTDKRTVKRIAYLSSPLDGVATIDLVTRFGESLSNLGPGWWSLAELNGVAPFVGAHYGRVLNDMLAVVATSVTKIPFHPIDNVIYGRGTRIKPDGLTGNGMTRFISQMGLESGPRSWAAEHHTRDVPSGELGAPFVDFVFQELLDREITYEYLWRRQQIEEYIRGDGDLLPLYIYWDERDNQYTIPKWREAYAKRDALYEMMWY